ncbi:MAG: nucleotide exchange factor GrpE [Alistipes sp.]|nr:nucleotide exchange factor GrpE [Alistipes sp.]
MMSKKVKNQGVDENVKAQAKEQSQQENQASADTMAEGANVESDTMAEGDNMPSADEQVALWQDKYLRLQAEFDNYRKRTLREKMELVESGGKDVLLSVLTVLDDMYRAVDASEKSDDINALREGERLVLHKFEDILSQKHVTPIEALGVEFNPDYHEAVARFAAGEDKQGKVIDVIQRGFMLGDKVLRYAKVVVGE